MRREIAERGPLAAGELSHQHKGEGGWWGWSDGKRAVEWLFWAGEVTTATRRGTFERVYGLTEQVLPRSVIEAPTPDEADAQRELLRISADAWASPPNAACATTFALDPADAKPRIAELVEAGRTHAHGVEGWDRPRLSSREARRPRRMEAQALLAPFDPLIWQRERVEALFGAASGSSSTRRVISACTATMCCRSCWATAS